MFNMKIAFSSLLIMLLSGPTGKLCADDAKTFAVHLPTVISTDVQRDYYTFNFPPSQAGGKTLLTGVRGVHHHKHLVYISGWYNSPGNTSTVPFVYKGDLSGNGEWFVLDYPSSAGKTVTGTNLYGPNNGPKTDIQVVGNYTTVEAGESALGCLYQGPITGGGLWTTLLPPSNDTVINTIAHSTMGDLVVGNYDTQLASGKAFIYDIKTGEYFDIVKPDAVSITAYGIWHNGGNSYTICGGYSNLTPSGIEPNQGLSTGYLVDWNRKKHTLSNWRSFSYDNDSVKSVVTHFDGITADGHGGYYLTGDWAEIADGQGIAFFAHVKKHAKKAKWSSISFPGQKITSGNTVYKKVVIGVYTNPDDNSVNGYVSIP